jgi:hypothetical protein
MVVKLSSPSPDFPPLPGIKGSIEAGKHRVRGMDVLAFGMSSDQLLSQVW